eukprot:TRINITY_DN104667_c0_g1_i1.p2 TRINITY_DN104667_c0_g1~~TRINITY_DN104667_c0_g1_i1.p2  ORF type:complete len:163 (-),score=38.12 TRINITY_DN104667_c0_g1_i1:67-555(-)
MAVTHVAAGCILAFIFASLSVRPVAAVRAEASGGVTEAFRALTGGSNASRNASAVARGDHERGASAGSIDAAKPLVDKPSLLLQKTSARSQAADIDAVAPIAAAAAAVGTENAAAVMSAAGINPVEAALMSMGVDVSSMGGLPVLAAAVGVVGLFLCICICC